MSTPTTDAQKTFVSSKGIELVLKPVSQFKIDTLKSTKVEVPVPQYQMTIAGGGKVNHPLDAIIAQNQDRMEEWNEYLKLRGERDAEYTKKFLELLIWDGVDIEVPGPESEWQNESNYFGIQIPTAPVERKLFYVYNECLGTPVDIGDLIAEILTVSNIDEEAVRNLRDSFRTGIQRQPNRRTSKSKKSMESKSDLQPTGSNSLLEPTP